MWVPVQELEWLDAYLNMTEFAIIIPKRRIDKAVFTIKEIDLSHVFRSAH